jgi:hypothetical protein
VSETQPPEQTPAGDEPAAIEPDAPTEAQSPEDLSAATVVDQPSPVTEVAAVPQPVAPAAPPAPELPDVPEPPPAIAAALEGKAVEPPVVPPEPGDSVSTPPPPVPEPSAWTPSSSPEGSDTPSGPAALAADRPEVAIGAAFAGGLVLALLLKRLAR